jgi:two-component system NarL family sensor kinase
MKVVRERVVDQASGGSVEFIDVFQQLINGLPEQIALVDEDWVILAVNGAWTKTAALYGYEALLPGTNYLRFCEARAAEGHRAAVPAVKGMKEIDAGARESFRYIYDGNDRWAGHSFQLTVNRLAIGGVTLATITRYDVTELAELRRLRAEFSETMILGQAEERRRIGREIHDSTLQLVTSLGLGLGQLKRSTKPKQTLDIVADMEHLLSEVHHEIRAISYLAHPPLLAEMGLQAALKTLAEGFGRRAGIAITVSFDGDVTFGSRGAQVAMYRIVQECLSNAHRHSGARNVAVGLIGRKSMIHAVVADDGVGLPEVIPSGVGLPGMRSRLAEMGGRLTIHRRIHGAMIVATLPRDSTLRAIGDLALPS